MGQNRILDLWSAEAKLQVEQNPSPEALAEYMLIRSTLYIDAGFSDPDYLDEVANDWLAQDLESAKEAGLSVVASHIQSKIDEINEKLNRKSVNVIAARGRESGRYKFVKTQLATTF